MTRKTYSLATMLVVAEILVHPVHAQIQLTWSTFDGGGRSFSTGASFSLGGTIGQYDAGVMTGGTFELAGGFWPVSQVCTCLGDMNADGLKDARDVQQLTQCIVAGGSCPCADVDALGGVTTADVSAFVIDLLNADGCP